jgi:hypothetical protein
MKKFWIVLIALGLVAAFSISASAADVKFSGSYYIEGWYDDNHSLLAKDDPRVGSAGGPIALYHQRLRVNTDFKVAEGLMLTTRFDALERNWGDRRERNYTGLSSSTANYIGTVEDASRNVAGANTVSAQEQANIEFERVFITANLPFGVLIAGYAEDIKWGTDFMDTVTTRPQIKLIVPIGNLTLVGAIKKDLEGTMYNGYGNINTSDRDIYDLAAVYKWKSGEAGLLFEYLNSNATKSTGYVSYDTKIWGLFPYFKQTFGPVYLEAEAYYGAGQMAEFDNTAGTIQKALETMGGSIHAKVDLKPVYFGGRFIYMMGDDPNTANKQEGTVAAQLVAGQAFLPCLMLFNDSYYTAIGSGLGGRAPTSTGLGGTQNAVLAGNAAAMQFMDNVIFFQGYVGVKPIDKLDIMAAVAYAMAQKKPNSTGAPGGIDYISDVYGTEVDVTATYKIYDNLSYMVGFGYLFTGDYFKGTDPTAKITNDYILMHKLTLTF